MMLVTLSSTEPSVLQILEPAAGQLTAAVLALMSSLTARNHAGRGVMGLVYQLSFARWGLEGCSCALQTFSNVYSSLHWKHLLPFCVCCNECKLVAGNAAMSCKT